MKPNDLITMGFADEDEQSTMTWREFCRINHGNPIETEWQMLSLECGNIVYCGGGAAPEWWIQRATCATTTEKSNNQ